VTVLRLIVACLLSLTAALFMALSWLTEVIALRLELWSTLLDPFATWVDHQLARDQVFGSKSTDPTTPEPTP